MSNAFFLKFELCKISWHRCKRWIMRSFSKRNGRNDFRCEASLPSTSYLISALRLSLLSVKFTLYSFGDVKNKKIFNRKRFFLAEKKSQGVQIIMKTYSSIKSFGSRILGRKRCVMPNLSFLCKNLKFGNLLHIR